MSAASSEFLWEVPDAEAAWMVFTGFAICLDDGTFEITPKGADFILDFLRRERAKANELR